MGMSWVDPGLMSLSVLTCIGPSLGPGRPDELEDDRMSAESPHPPNGPGRPEPSRAGQASRSTGAWWFSSASEADRFIFRKLSRAPKIVGILLIVALSLFILTLAICTYNMNL